MAEPHADELTFILEDEEPLAPTGSLRREFEEIPHQTRREVEEGLRQQAYELLHAEAVERGELDSAPAEAAAVPRLVLRGLLWLGIGALGGGAAVAAATALLRWVTSTIR